MADAVKRLIAAMDEIDGDPDMEGDDPDLEPSLGSTITGSIYQADWTQGGGSDFGVRDDLEVACEDEGFNSDDEPNADDQGNTWVVTPFALNQEGTKWAFGEGSHPFGLF